MTEMEVVVLSHVLAYTKNKLSVYIPGSYPPQRGSNRDGILQLWENLISYPPLNLLIMEETIQNGFPAPSL